MARLLRRALQIAGLALTLGLAGLPAQAQSSSVLRAFGALAYSLAADQVAVIINLDDPLSVRVGEYYRAARHIPKRNVVRVHVPGSPPSLDAARFAELRREILEKLDDNIQAVVMVWTTPYAVECNSITWALTAGFDGEQCKQTCGPGKASPYFNSASARPYADLGLRLSMLLPITSEKAARALIDRGVKSDGMAPAASAYFLVTSDQERSVRARFFPPTARVAQPAFTIRTLRADSLEGRRDVMIYETGLPRVGKLESLRFLPGALADHLTSFGGKLTDSPQMSSLEWLEAGATASYGTVSEPCSHWQKFPHPGILLKSYLSGATAIEAYWKSVAWPSQGLFIGEPLAAPYRPRQGITR